MVDLEPVPPPYPLDALNEQQLRAFASSLMAQIAHRDQAIIERDELIAQKDQDILYRQAKIDQFTHELAVVKRWKFSKSREQLAPAQASVLDEAIDGDIAAIQAELEQLVPTAATTHTRKAAAASRCPRICHGARFTTCQTRAVVVR